MKDLSVVMVYYKGAERQSRCVDSLHVIEDKRLSFEVMVVANRSGDGGSFYRFSPALFFPNTGKNVFANGCNCGAAKSTGDCLLFLNP